MTAPESPPLHGGGVVLSKAELDDDGVRWGGHGGAGGVERLNGGREGGDGGDDVRRWSVRRGRLPS